MGGDYYDRPPLAGALSTCSSSASYSAVSDAVFNGAHAMHADCTPANRILECKTEDAVVVAIDVTGYASPRPPLLSSTSSFSNMHCRKMNDCVLAETGVSPAQLDKIPVCSCIF